MKKAASDMFGPMRQPSGRSALRHDGREAAEPAAAQGSFERGTVVRYARGTEIITQGDAEGQCVVQHPGLLHSSTQTDPRERDKAEVRYGPKRDSPEALLLSWFWA